MRADSAEGGFHEGPRFAAQKVTPLWLDLQLEIAYGPVRAGSAAEEYRHTE